MPWDKDNPPTVSKNWTPDEQAKCTAAANAVLEREGWDGADEAKKKNIERNAIFACIHAAGKSQRAVEVLEDESLDWKEAAEPSVNYLEKFRQLVIDMGYFTKEQIGSIMKAARGYAGGKAKGQGHVDGMAFEDILPPKVKGMSDSSLILLHKRLHGLYADSEDQDSVKAAHGHVVNEMVKRKLAHYRRDELDGG